MPSPVQDSAAAMAGKNGHSLISTDKFRQLFHALIESQLLNQHLRSSGRPAAVAPNCEAGPAGLVLDLRPDDTLLLPSTTHFAHRVKGAPLKAILSQPGTALGGAPFTESCPHSVPTAGRRLSRRLSEAIGCALHSKLEKNGAIVLTLFDLAPSNGLDSDLSRYDEVFTIATVHKLPILFVIENYDGFIDSLAFKATHPALPYISVDAHDVVAVYRVAQESIVRTREGSGPALIELASIRPGGEDPIEKMHFYLTAKGLPAEEWRAEAARQFETQLSEACHLQPDPLA
jgi:TPP-dependent pyruvate/acetoin dehydrogenase alpha subunit